MATIPRDPLGALGAPAAKASVSRPHAPSLKLQAKVLHTLGSWERKLDALRDKAAAVAEEVVSAAAPRPTPPSSRSTAPAPPPPVLRALSVITNRMVNGSGSGGSSRGLPSVIVKERKKETGGAPEKARRVKVVPEGAELPALIGVGRLHRELFAVAKEDVLDALWAARPQLLNSTQIAEHTRGRRGREQGVDIDATINENGQSLRTVLMALSETSRLETSPPDAPDAVVVGDAGPCPGEVQTFRWVNLRELRLGVDYGPYRTLRAQVIGDDDAAFKDVALRLLVEVTRGHPGMPLSFARIREESASAAASGAAALGNPIFHTLLSNFGVDLDEERGVVAAMLPKAQGEPGPFASAGLQYSEASQTISLPSGSARYLLPGGTRGDKGASAVIDLHALPTVEAFVEHLARATVLATGSLDGMDPVGLPTAAVTPQFQLPEVLRTLMGPGPLPRFLAVHCKTGQLCTGLGDLAEGPWVVYYRDPALDSAVQALRCPKRGSGGEAIEEKKGEESDEGMDSCSSEGVGRREYLSSTSAGSLPECRSSVSEDGRPHSERSPGEMQGANPSWVEVLSTHRLAQVLARLRFGPMEGLVVDCLRGAALPRTALLSRLQLRQIGRAA
eukprot:RCo001626